MLLGALSDAQKAGIGAMGAAFIVFALVSSFVIPRRKPNFPGGRGVWPYVGLVACFFVAMMAVVVFVGKEKSEAKAESSTPGATSPVPPAPAAQGDPAAGKAVFLASGCSSCHTFKPAGATQKVGPDLDNLADYAKKANMPLADFTRSAITKPPAAYVPPGFPTNVMQPDGGKKLSEKQLADLVAFLTQPS